MTSPNGATTGLATERRHPDSAGLGTMTGSDVVSLMESEEPVVLTALQAAHAGIVAAAEAVAATFLRAGRTVLLGAGTSGRLAVQEVSELPPTFGVPPDRFIALVASGVPLGPASIATSEDATSEVGQALHQMGIGPGDAVIGVAASGRTPFVLAGIDTAAAAGAWTCGIANSAGTPLLTAGGMGILLDTGPELLTGSTRLKAGTSQKIALNRITTAAMVIAGRVRSNYMTEMRATNEKLRDRAVRIVVDLAQVTPSEAERLLSNHGWHVGDTLRAVDAAPAD